MSTRDRFTVYVASTVFVMMVFILFSHTPTMANPIGDLEDGTCGGFIDYDNVIDNWDGALSCGGGRVFRQNPFLSVDFHYEAQFEAGYDGLAAMPPTINSIAPINFMGFGSIDFNPRRIDLNIQSQVEDDIPLSFGLTGYGADGSMAFTGLVFDPTAEENETIPLQLSLTYRATLNCDIKLNCALGNNYEMFLQSKDTGQWDAQIIDSKFLSAGPGQGVFSIHPGFGDDVDCKFNVQIGFNECEVDITETEIIPVLNFRTYGISFGAFTGLDATIGGYANVDNSNSWTATITPTEANPNATFVLVPEPGTLGMLSLAAMLMVKRS